MSAREGDYLVFLLDFAAVFFLAGAFLALFFALLVFFAAGLRALLALFLVFFTATSASFFKRDFVGNKNSSSR